jgi:hypothetical protein
VTIQAKRGADFDIRPGAPDDQAFIFTTWLKCMSRESDFAKHILPDLFMRTHHGVAERALDRSSVHVAHAMGEESVILGYLVTEGSGGMVHFAYVKRPFRRSGIFRALLDSAGVDTDRCRFTHLTRDAEAVLQRCHPKATYWPYGM